MGVTDPDIQWSVETPWPTHAGRDDAIREFLLRFSAPPESLLVRRWSYNGSAWVFEGEDMVDANEWMKDDLLAWRKDKSGRGASEE